MDQVRFDDLVRLCALPSRRGFLAAFSTTVLGALVGRDLPNATLAKRKKKGKKRRKRTPQPPPTSAPGPTGCLPACGGKTCGGDGCGGRCGDCPAGTICRSNGTCLTCHALGQPCGPSAGGEICCDLPCGVVETPAGSVYTCRRITCGSVGTVCGDDLDCCNGVCDTDKRCRLQAVFCAGKNSCASASNPCHVPGSGSTCECFVTSGGDPVCADMNNQSSAASCADCAQQGKTCLNHAGGFCAPDGNVICVAACPNPR